MAEAKKQAKKAEKVVEAPKELTLNELNKLAREGFKKRRAEELKK